MKLFYITNARIPTNKAHGIQILKMGEAFTRIIGESNFLLLLPDRPENDPKLKNKNIGTLYGLKTMPNFKKIPVVDFHDYVGDISFLKMLAYWSVNVSFGISTVLYCLKNQPKIIYTRDFYLVPFLLIIGAPLYYEAHYFPANPIFIFLHKLLVPKLAGVVVLTKFFKTYFDQYGFKYKKILVAPDATDTEFFKMKKIEHDGLIIGYIGRLSGLGEDKGGNILIKAFKKVYRKNKNIELLFVGEKGEEKIPGVAFTGNLPYGQMPYYFNLIDIAVIPYPDRPHFRYFMSPLKLFDYLACSKPIVTSDLLSVREILTEDNAIFFPPGDSDKLAKAIEKLIRDKKLRSKMGQDNLSLSKKYTWDKRAKLVYDFIC